MAIFFRQIASKQFLYIAFIIGVQESVAGERFLRGLSL